MRIGVDLVDIRRLRAAFDLTPSFGAITYSTAELVVAAGMGEHEKSEFLAGRFAVKEAVLKALGTGMSGAVSLSEIECLSEDSGAPVLRLYGEALRCATGLGLKEFAVSISHESGLVVAMVVLS